MRLKTGIFRSNTVKWLFSLFLVIGIAAIVTAAAAISAQRGSTRIVEVVETTKPPSSNWTGLAMYMNLTILDPEIYKYKIHIEFEPRGDLVDEFKNLKQNTRLFIDDQSVFCEKNRIIPSEEFAFALSEGDFNDYPFDFYMGDVIFSASVLDEKNATTPIPLYYQIASDIQGWKIQQYWTDLDDDLKHLGLKITAQRSLIARAFSIYIIVMMWGLSLSVFALALSMLIQKRKIIPQAIGLCTGMLFALPNVRSTQPGMPQIGCLADVMGFFWNILIVAISGISLLIVYIYQTLHPDTEQPKQPLLDKKQTTVNN